MVIGKGQKCTCSPNLIRIAVFVLVTLQLMLMCYFTPVKVRAGVPSPQQVSHDATRISDPLVTIDLKDADIRDVLRMLAIQGGTSIVADATVSGPVTVHLQAVPLGTALELLAKANGYRLTKENGVYRVGRDPANLQITVQGTPDRLEIFAYDAPLADVLTRVAEVASMNLVQTGQVLDRVSVRLSDVSATEALDVILQGTGYVLTGEGNSYRLTPRLPSVDRAKYEYASDGSKLGISVEAGSQAGNVSVNAISADLGSLLFEVARVGGLNLIVHASSSTVSALSVTEQPARRVIEALASLHHLAVEEFGDTLLVTESEVQNNKDAAPAFSIQHVQGQISILAFHAPVEAVLYELAYELGLNIVIPPSLRDKDVTLHLKDVTAHVAFKELGSLFGYDTSISDTAVQFQIRDSYDLQQAREQPNKASKELAAAPFSVERQGALLTVMAEDAPIGPLLLATAQAAGLNITLTPDVKGTVSLQLSNVSGAEAILQEAYAAGYRAKAVDDLIVVDRSPTGPYEVRAHGDQIYVSAIDAPFGELASAIASTVGVSISLDPDVEGRVTGSYQGLSWRAMLDSIAERLGYAIDETGPILRIGTPAKPVTLSTGASSDLPRGIGFLNLAEGKLSFALNNVSGQVFSEELVRRLNQEPGFPALFFDRDVMALQLNGSAHDVPIIQAIRDLFTPYGYELVAGEAGYRVRRTPGPPPVQVRLEGDRIYISAENADLGMVLRELGAQTGKTFVIDPGASTPISAFVQGLPLTQALDALLTPYGRRWQEVSGYIRVNRIDAVPASTVPRQAVEQASGAAASRPPDGVKKFELSGDKVYADLDGVSVALFLEMLSQKGIGPYLVDPNVTSASGRLTGRVEGGPVTDAIRRFLEARGFHLLPLAEGFYVRMANDSQPWIYQDNKGLFYIVAQNADLGQVLRTLAMKAGVNLVLYTYARVSLNSVQLLGVSFAEALDRLLKGTTLTYVIGTGGVYFVGEGVTPRSDSPELTQSKVFDLQYVQASQIASILPASIPAQNVRVVPGENKVVVSGSPSLIAAFADFAAAVDQPGSDSYPSLVSTKYVAAEEITALLAKVMPAQFFSYLPSANVFVISGPSVLREQALQFIEALDAPGIARRTEVIPLRYVKADRAKELLPPTIDRARVLVATEQNGLIVTARPDELLSIREFLQEIDVRNPQVIFDISVYEVSDRGSQQFGTNHSIADGSLKIDLLGPSPLSLSLGSLHLPSAKLLTTISTLVQEGKARILANPQIAVLNGNEATFNVVTKSRYWDPRTLPKEGGSDGSTGSTTTVPDFRTIETGIRLRLKPWVSPAGEITLELQPEISDSAGTSSGSGLPQTNDRSVHTVVRVKDGETLVLSGLRQRIEHVDVSKVPILGDLPLIGFLFRSTKRTESVTEFVISITPHLEKSEKTLLEIEESLD